MVFFSLKYAKVLDQIFPMCSSTISNRPKKRKERVYWKYFALGPPLNCFLLKNIDQQRTTNPVECSWLSCTRFTGFVRKCHAMLRACGTFPLEFCVRKMKPPPAGAEHVLRPRYVSQVVNIKWYQTAVTVAARHPYCPVLRGNGIHAKYTLIYYYNIINGITAGTDGLEM